MKARARTLQLVSAAGAVLAVFATAAFGNDEAAHAIADRFARAKKAQPVVDVDRDRQILQKNLEDEARFKADEEQMLERARAEAAERKAAQARQDAAAGERAAAAERERLAAERNQRRAAREKEAAAARERAAADRVREASRIVEEQRKADEFKIQREKAEAERVAKETEAKRQREQQVEAERLANLEKERKDRERAEADRVTQAAAKQREMEAAREEEGRRLSEKLRKAREARELKSLDRGFSALGGPPGPDALGATPPAGKVSAMPAPHVEPGRGEARVHRVADVDIAHDTRATVLLIIDSGTRGIRRYGKTADPVLCVGKSCYVSNGPDQPAVEMSRGRALGPGNTLGRRAGACRHALGCVFRDVEIGHAGIDLQPIDLRILRHDRREVQVVETDGSCHADRGRLDCSHGVRSRTYSVWVVPESVARKAGPAALLSAIDRGLPDGRAAELEADR